jgi:hypothetical protein
MCTVRGFIAKKPCMVALFTSAARNALSGIALLMSADVVQLMNDLRRDNKAQRERANSLHLEVQALRSAGGHTQSPSRPPSRAALVPSACPGTGRPEPPQCSRPSLLSKGAGLARAQGTSGEAGPGSLTHRPNSSASSASRGGVGADVPAQLLRGPTDVSQPGAEGGEAGMPVDTSNLQGLYSNQCHGVRCIGNAFGSPAAAGMLTMLEQRPQSLPRAQVREAPHRWRPMHSADHQAPKLLHSRSACDIGFQTHGGLSQSATRPQTVSAGFGVQSERVRAVSRASRGGTSQPLRAAVEVQDEWVPLSCSGMRDSVSEALRVFGGRGREEGQGPRTPRSRAPMRQARPPPAGARGMRGLLPEHDITMG